MFCSAFSPYIMATAFRPNEGKYGGSASRHLAPVWDSYSIVRVLKAILVS
jgi:hypothetical protein